MQLTTRDIRTLKGAALAILVLGLLDPQPHSADWYGRMSGYTDKPVTQALKLLVEHDFMLRTSGGWVIAADQQLKLSTVYPQIEPLNRNYSDSVASSSCSSLNKNEKIITIEKEEEQGLESELFRFNLEACRDAGIRNPKASQLAALDHVSPDFIKAHVKAVVAEGLAVGTAIYRIEHNWTVRHVAEPDNKRLCLRCGAQFDPGPDASKYLSLCPDCE